jgi:hypothetical protein
MIHNVDVDDFTSTAIVETTTLDSLVLDINETPTVIKIDVQGNEPVVLRGGRNLFANNRPKIFLEIDPFSLKVCELSVFDILSFVDRYDYRPYLITNELIPISIISFISMCERISKTRGHYNDVLLVHESQLKEIP